MNCSRIIRIRLDARLRVHIVEHRHPAAAAMLAPKVLTVVRSLRWQAIAGAFLLLVPSTFANVTITAGVGSLEAHTQIEAPICVQDGQASFSAPIGNPSDPPTNSLHINQCSTTNPNTGAADFVGPIDLHGGFTGNAQSMTLTVSGSGSEKADVLFFRTHEVSALTVGDIEFEVTGGPTVVPISISMTVPRQFASQASCQLRDPDGQVIGEIIADNDGQHGSFPQGALSPGLYVVTLNYHYQTLLTEGFTNYNFNFSAEITVNGTAPESPALSCPPNVTTNNAPGECAQMVAFAAAVTGGNPTPVLTYKMGTTVITSPYSFPVGTNVVTVTATNGVPTDKTCSFTVAVVAPTQQPLLTIFPSGTNVVLCWSNIFGCYALHYTPQLLSPSATNVWMVQPGPFVPGGGNIYVTNPIGTSNRFFRLSF